MKLVDSCGQLFLVRRKSTMEIDVFRMDFCGDRWERVPTWVSIQALVCLVTIQHHSLPWNKASTLETMQSISTMMMMMMIMNACIPLACLITAYPLGGTTIQNREAFGFYFSMIPLPTWHIALVFRNVKLGSLVKVGFSLQRLQVQSSSSNLSREQGFKFLIWGKWKRLMGFAFWVLSLPQTGKYFVSEIYSKG